MTDSSAFPKDPSDTHGHHDEWVEAITDTLLSNMKNSLWHQQGFDVAALGDRWVRQFFKYPDRHVLPEPYPPGPFIRKAVNIPDYALAEFYDSLSQIGIEHFATLEVYDCDSASRRSDCAEYLYISMEDFERAIKPRLTEKPDVDFRDVTGMNDPHRIILLGDTPIKASQLMRYFEIVGANTPEKRMWNTPDYEKLMRTLELDKS